MIEIKAGAKVALVADWGTGATPALQVLSQIAKLSPDVFIHLGDVYYSGTPKEYDVNFRHPLESILGSDRRNLPIYALAGNHDMYCGGVGYYDAINKFNPEPLRQPASYFCLRSSDQRWQLLAMDTGLHDFSPLSVEEVLTWLEPEEIEWHHRRVAEFGGRTILLSHHQLFSAFSPIGTAQQNGQRQAVNSNLASTLKILNVDNKIAAWFWGHEHNLCIYNCFAGLERGRCIGYGAVPVFATDDCYAPIGGLPEFPSLIENTKLQTNGAIWAHGFAFLTLGNDAHPCRADYYQESDGQALLVHSEPIA